MRRGPLTAALIVAATSGALILAGCGSTTHEDNESDLITTPPIGACRVLSAKDLTAPSNHSSVVDCAQHHTAQTFATGELPASTGTGYDDQGHGRFVYDVCQQALTAFLGADESIVLRSQLSWSWFRPSKKGWARGARWYRCDVVGGPVEASTLRDLPPDARGLFADDLPDAWLTCARGETAEQGNKVPCNTAHDWRAVTTIKLAEPGAPYPGDRIVEVRSRDYCRDSVRGWLNYPPTFDFGYTWYHQDRWDGGNRRSICWARTTS